MQYNSHLSTFSRCHRGKIFSYLKKYQKYASGMIFFEASHAKKGFCLATTRAVLK
jgi:hypothetical protein